MNQASIESFLCIAKHKSFSKAANELNITQPAISKRISQLEDSLGSQLFDRTGKNVQLTHSGTIFLEKANIILDTIKDCKTAVRNTQLRIEGPLNLGVSHHIGLHRLPPYLKTFSKKFPDVQLNLHFVDSEEAYKLVKSGELELALATLSPTPIEHIKDTPLWNDALAFVVSGDHPLAKANTKRQLTLNDLTEHPAILPNLQTYTGKIIAKLFEQNQLKITHHIETNYMETIRMMISIGLGWAILPRTMINNQLKGLALNTPRIHRKLGYLHHDKRTISNAAAAFINNIQKNI